jgi:Kef-type K+ transport system membrane component KefB
MAFWRSVGWGLDPLFLTGLAVIAGYYGARGVKFFKAPQVVGYVVIGVVLNLLNIFDFDSVHRYDTVCSIALGFIGLGIGTELRWQTIRKLSRVIMTIVVFESFGATLIVGGLVYLVTRDLGLSLVLGALAAATAPAGTVDVLQEYQSKGPLTTILYAVVALDDAAALMIYGFFFPIVKALYAPGADFSLVHVLLVPAEEIFFSLLCGGLLGAAFAWLFKRVRKESDVLILGVASVFLCSGLAATFNLSLILANMALGMTLVNIAPFASRRAVQAMSGFTPPVYVLFFVLVGARLELLALPSMGFVGLLYIAGRTAGKWGGAYLGGCVAGAELVIRRFLGMGLFSQAGVAIGLALSFYNELAPLGGDAAALGLKAISIITATTFVVQIAGPPFVKKAIFAAGEARKTD